MFLPEPTIFISDPNSQPKVKNTEYTPKTRLPEFSIIVDPSGKETTYKKTAKKL